MVAVADVVDQDYYISLTIAEQQPVVVERDVFERRTKGRKRERQKISSVAPRERKTFIF